MLLRDLLLGRLHAGFGGLQRGADLVAADHQLQHDVLDPLHLALRRFDLVLHGVVFAVRLHFHQLVFVAGEAGLNCGEVFFEGAAVGLVGGLPRFGLRHHRARAFEFLVERALCFRDCGLLPSCLRRLQIERLQVDQACQVGMHGENSSIGRRFAWHFALPT